MKGRLDTPKPPRGATHPPSYAYFPDDLQELPAFQSQAQETYESSYQFSYPGHPVHPVLVRTSPLFEPAFSPAPKTKLAMESCSQQGAGSSQCACVCVQASDIMSKAPDHVKVDFAPVTREAYAPSAS